MKRLLLLTNLLAFWVRTKFARTSDPCVTFNNIGEGTFEHGKKSFLPDAATVTTVAAQVTAGTFSDGRYLCYEAGATSNDYCALAQGANRAIGVSDDSPDVGVPIGIKLFGATQGTVRVRAADTSPTHLGWLKVSTTAATYGAVVAATSTGTDIVVGRAILDSDQTTVAAGDVIQMIPIMPTKIAY